MTLRDDATDERLLPHTAGWQQRYFLASEFRPEWFDRLEWALVNAGLCEWSARRAPHPQDVALVVAEFFSRLADESFEPVLAPSAFPEDQ